VKVIKKVVPEKSPAGISLHYLSVREKRRGLRDMQDLERRP
jgi:hypothetical protein